MYHEHGDRTQRKHCYGICDSICFRSPPSWLCWRLRQSRSTLSAQRSIRYFRVRRFLTVAAASSAARASSVDMATSSLLIYLLERGTGRGGGGGADMRYSQVYGTRTKYILTGRASRLVFTRPMRLRRSKSGRVIKSCKWQLCVSF